MIPDNDTDLIYFSELLNLETRFINTFKEISEILDHYKIKYAFLPNTKDIWARDYMPIQISKNKFLEYRYDPDYLQGKKYRKLKSHPDIICEKLNIVTQKTDIILDGGNIVKSSNCVVLTDKVIEENRDLYNPHQLIEKLKGDFEVEKIVLIPWDKEMDYLGHADGMLRFIDNKTVLLQGVYDQYDDVFKQRLFGSLEESGLKWKMLKFNVKAEDERNWAYLNFLQTKDILLIPSFGIEEDEQALSQISEFFTDYKKRDRIRQVNLAEIVKEGGALNCITWTVKES